MLQRLYSATHAETYRHSRRWAEQFTPQVIDIIQNEVSKRIGKSVLVKPASFYADVAKATDLVAVSGDQSTTFAMRVRKYEDFRRYGHQFTIRLERDTGSETELAKMIDKQMARYMFYGFANQTEDGLHSWFIGRLDVLRKALQDDPTLLTKADVRHNKPEGDKIVSFIAFNIDDLSEDFIVERKTIACE